MVTISTFVERKVEVVKYVYAIDCGTAINPKLAEGQVEGAVFNGISYALTGFGSTGHRKRYLRLR